MKQRKLDRTTGSPPRLLPNGMKPEVGGFVRGGEADCPGSAAPSPNLKQSLLDGVFGLEGWFTFWAEAIQSQRF